jgi:hypothetical protein
VYCTPSRTPGPRRRERDGSGSASRSTSSPLNAAYRAESSQFRIERSSERCTYVPRLLVVRLCPLQFLICQGSEKDVQLLEDAIVAHDGSSGGLCTVWGGSAQRRGEGGGVGRKSLRPTLPACFLPTDLAPKQSCLCLTSSCDVTDCGVFSQPVRGLSAILDLTSFRALAKPARQFALTTRKAAVLHLSALAELRLEVLPP